VKYLEVDIHCPEEQKEVLIALLSDAGFEGFWEESYLLKCYIPEAEFSKKSLYTLLSSFHLENAFQVKPLEDKNWNATWEENFDPVLVDDRLSIRAPFHAPLETLHEIIVEPNMTFGTGHHETTFLMMEMMLTTDFHVKKVLDMGSGTGILAILAEKLGAATVLGIDNQIGSRDNAEKNAKYNACKNVKFLEASLDALKPEDQFDCILSNITKNINKELLPFLFQHLKPNGILVVAGFLNFDLNEMNDFIIGLGGTLKKSMSKKEWECLMYQKITS
jgi:ribosomal protein L11 methyltransferase